MGHLPFVACFLAVAIDSPAFGAFAGTFGAVPLVTGAAALGWLDLERVLAGMSATEGEGSCGGKETVQGRLVFARHLLCLLARVAVFTCWAGGSPPALFGVGLRSGRWWSWTEVDEVVPSGV